MACTDKNPLIREGTSLLNRVLAALSVTYAKADERQAEDLILFARRYAAELNFYKEDNTTNDNWQSLMSGDVSVPLAILTRINVQEISDYKRRIYKQITLAADDDQAKEEFKFLFDLIFSSAKMVDQQFVLLPGDFEYKALIADRITHTLKVPLAIIENYFNSFKTASLLDYSISQLDNDAPVPVVSEENFSVASDMSEIWQITGPLTIPTITLPGLPTAKENILYVINHNLFNAQIESLFNGISSIVNRAHDLFVQTLGEYPDHAPHYALFISFLKLFAHAQDEINTYTQRHLDFYYKEVLQLVNKAPEPDSVHLLFELQKPVGEDRLVKDTLFKGGKDSTGKEIRYALTEDVVLNKTILAKIHSTQITGETTGIFFKASPVANSDDGQGAKITTADKSWFTFGDPKKIKNTQAGFAIASNILFLNEGDRLITITVNFANPVPELATFNLNCFTARFTGRKKWEPVSSLSVSANALYKQLIFSVPLTPDDPAVVSYSEKIHQQNRNVELPVLEIYLSQDGANGIPYTLLCKSTISSVVVNVNVSGIRDLSLSNDNGAIDASKPFKPFGDFPDTGSGFYLGSKEIFQKPLTELDIITDWKSPSGGPELQSHAHYLRQNYFDNNPYNLNADPGAVKIAFSGSNGPFIPTVIDFTKNESITADTLAGFLRIRLNTSLFSLSTHLNDISTQLSNGTNITYDSSINGYRVNIGATPVPSEVVLNSLSLNYIAETTILFDAGESLTNDLFYHLTPFGFSVVNDALVDTSSDVEPSAKTTLLQDVLNEGELFLGLENAAPQSVVTILFQVSDGSSNPLHDIETLHWYYLAHNNNWKIFKSENIVDNTNDFTQSGIVILTLPPDIDNKNTLLEQGLHWIKVTAHPFSDTVCRMIQIQAQAARVQLVQDDAAGIEFRQVLPASSISKLVASDSSIKTIQQPADSFNGRVRETDDRFYVRVSERLRHKQRAIAVWDYEHIVLEEFPKIFKVKCINDAGFYTQQGNEVFCENFAGHVSIITIPDQINNSGVNPLRPYTPIGLLNNIHEYLKTKTSPFVKLHVKQPQFEEIQLDFKVSFYEHFDPSFYTTLLNSEIERFLCPWAFDNAVEISFGGSIYKSALINFVEERPYVDFVTCFKMYQIINRTDPPVDVEVATGSTARSILVSYYDEDNNIKHLIDPIASCTC